MEEEDGEEEVVVEEEEEEEENKVDLTRKNPHAALQTAEPLYLSGYLSYPRTQSSAYPKSFDIAGTLQSQASDNQWGSYIRDLLMEGHNKSRGGVDMGDHPPITPCQSAGPDELS